MHRATPPALFALMLGTMLAGMSARAQQYPEGMAAPAGGVDLSGEWTPVRKEDNTGNPELGDWVGIPMNEAARLRAMAWVASIQTLAEWQCRPHGRVLHFARTVAAAHFEGGRSGLARDHRVAHGVAAVDRQGRSIWTAGRIRRRTRRTPGAGFRPASGSATC